jgi:predicted PurR-regulated permease PerM
MNKKREVRINKGITLIALVITVIILLILAGVTINMVFDGGIIEKAQNAVDKYNEAAKNEQEALNAYSNMLQNIYAGTGE